MFPPSLIARKESRKDLLSQPIFPVCFGGLRKPMLVLSKFRSTLSSLSPVWSGELRQSRQFWKENVRNVSWINLVFYSYLQRSVANSHYLKLRNSSSKGSRQIKGEDHENAVAEAGYVIFRLLPKYRIAFSTRRISFEHHPFLGWWINYSLIIKWKIHGIIRLTPADFLR